MHPAYVVIGSALGAMIGISVLAVVFGMGLEMVFGGVFS